MPTQATTARMDAQWAAALGCVVDDLYRCRVTVAPHGNIAGYQGVMLLRRGDACIVSVPSAMVDAVRQQLMRHLPTLRVDAEHEEPRSQHEPRAAGDQNLGRQMGLSRLIQR